MIGIILFGGRIVYISHKFLQCGFVSAKYKHTCIQTSTYDSLRSLMVDVAAPACHCHKAYHFLRKSVQTYKFLG